MKSMKLIALSAAALALVCSDVWADDNDGRFSVLNYDCERVVNVDELCISYSEEKFGTDTYHFPYSDFSWKCNSLGYLEVNFFNSSLKTVYTIVIEGATTGKRLSEDVIVPPGESGYVYSLAGESFCSTEKRAELYYEYTTRTGGFCRETLKGDELRAVKAECEKHLAEKEERDAIYSNCVVAKSKDVDTSVLPNVRSICRKISENPSLWQRLRWGE